MQKNIASDIWIISEGRATNIDLSTVCNEYSGGPATEYNISELAQYLLNPNSISIEEKIIGCKVFNGKSARGKTKGQKSESSLKQKKEGDKQNDLIEEILSESKLTLPSFQDEALNRHFTKIREILKPYDPAHKKISRIDSRKIEDIKAICEDIGGNRYQLNLKGSIKDKINFVMNSISNKTRIIINKSYLLNGLFELRGFRFDSFNPSSQYKLIKFSNGNQPKHCVLTSDYKFMYFIDDSVLVTYMHLLEQSIRNDSKMKEAMIRCIKGDAIPLKLFFLNQMERSYSGERLPMLYRRVFNTYDITASDKEVITNILNNNQRIVVFNSIPQNGAGSNKLFTCISVMHDFMALEQIRSQLPEVYSEINKKASMSDAGKLYLLESMRGYQNV
jgi:hypothetical protein